MSNIAMIFMTASSMHALPNGLLSSLCFQESKHDTSAIRLVDGSSTSYGVCQIKLSTARMLGFKGSANKLMEPTTNIFYAAKYLSKHLSRLPLQRAIIAYNRGTAGSYQTTRYSQAVLKHWINYNKQQKEINYAAF